MKPAFIVHGGAGQIDPELHAKRLEGIKVAAQAGWELLQEGASALDAVEKAVMMLEDIPVFDAGIGSVLRQDGTIELDAMIMDGKTLRLGAVAAVQRIQNPVRLARLVMEKSVHNMLVGVGAQRFAQTQGIPLVPAELLITEHELKRFRRYQQTPPNPSDEPLPAKESTGTVGAVALDRAGNIAAATSTGGTAFSLAGRVGDTPLVGSGTHADNETGGASAIGHGERIMEVVLAKHATDLIRGGYTAQQAASAAIAYMEKRVNGRGGVIVIDHQGSIGFAHNTAYMGAAWFDEQGNLQTHMTLE